MIPVKIIPKSVQSFNEFKNSIVEVIKTAFIDPTDKKKKFVAVQVRFKKMLKKAVSLESIKKNKDLKHLSLIKQSRLSVMSIDSKSWKILNKMSNIDK